MKQLTLGSLFDGIGGFCYAAGIPSGIDTGCTIKPLWAAEVEPNCIDITRYRFKDVMHVGSVTELKGDEIQPVDIITFGSPCQDLSIAGKRKGLKGNRSGLFIHAIRIIREMRLATNGQYPTFIIWENVPGAFSSNGGEDFRAVLEKVTNANIPMPASGKWATAGMVRGGEVDTAWRILDAQYWGVPQRRKRIYLIGDFGGQRAGEILFKSESVLGYTPKSKKQRAEAAGQSTNSLRTESSRGGEVLGLDFAHADSVVRTYKDITPTLVQNMGRGGGQTPCIMYEEKRSVIPLRDEVTRNKASNGLGVGKVGGPCPTLTTADIHSVFYEAYQHHGYRESDTSGTLTAGQNNTVRGDTPLIVTDKKAFEENQHGGYRETQINGTLRAAGGSYGGGSETLITESTKTKGNIPSTPKKSIKDLLKKATQKVVYIIRRLTPVEGERLQGYPDDWTKYGADGNIIADTARYRAIGNSICVYCAERLYIGIIRILQEEEKDNERKDESLL